jgi:competence protein ComEC
MQEIIRNNPFVRLVFPFILGISTSLYFGTISELCIYYSLLTSFVAISLILILGYSTKLRVIVNLLFIVIFFLLGCYRTSVTEFQPEEFNNHEVIVARVLDFPDTTSSSLKVKIQLTTKITDSIYEPLSGGAIVYFQESEKTSDLIPGNQIVLKAKPELINNMGNPFEFDYKSWAANNNIYYSFFVKDEDWFLQNQPVGIDVLFELKKIRRSILNHYKKVGISDDQLSVFTALTLGDKSMLETELRDGFAAAGLMHVLAVSGLHVGIIYLVVKFLCSVFLKLKYGKVFRFIISILVLWGYASLTGLSPSVTRAATMFSIFVLGDLLGRRYAVYNSIALAAFVLLFYNPLLIKNVGFQMSFLAVFGIVFFYPMIYKWIYVPNKWIDKLWQLIAVSLAAQLITTPLSLYYFNQFPLLFLLSNILMIPLVTLLMYLFVLLVISLPFNAVASKVGWSINELTHLMNSFANWVNNIDWAVYKFGSFGGYQILILYLLLAIVTWFGFRTNYKFFKLTVLSVIVFVGIDTFRSYNLQSKNRFIVFNTYKQPLWLLASGNQFTLGNPTQSSSFDRFVEPVLQGFNIENEIQFDKPGDVTFFGKNNYSGIFYNLDYFPQNDSLKCRWLILSEKTPGNILKLLSNINTTHIIADATVPKYKLKDWRRMLKNTDKKIYSVTENGAFFETWNQNHR